VAAGSRCPRKFLLAHDTALLIAANAHALDNANTPQDLKTMQGTQTVPGPA
jgi:molybdopterin-guanine dinucleotide biosynthesis protein A